VGSHATDERRDAIRAVCADVYCDLCVKLEAGRQPKNRVAAFFVGALHGTMEKEGIPRPSFFMPRAGLKRLDVHLQIGPRAETQWVPDGGSTNSSGPQAGQSHVAVVSEMSPGR
jgi:hypothetical protein